MTLDGLAELAQTQTAGFDEGTTAAKPWPSRPAPLPPLTDPVPSLPAVYLPAPLRAWTEDAAERIGVPLEYIATPALVGLAALVGRTVGIHPHERDDWLVVPNVWGAIVGRPGWLKSPAQHEGLRPVYRLAERARIAFADGAAARECAALERNAKVDTAKKRLRDAAVASDEGQMTVVGMDLETLLRDPTPDGAAERRYVTQDATTEKLGELLIENPRGILLARDELAGWLRSLERHGREGDREFFLEAWNGTGSYTVDRIGRGTLHVPALTISVFGGIQPAKLSPYVAALAGRGDDGLLQRFQLLVWPDTIGEWRNVTRWPDTAARERAHKAYEGADALDPAALGATVAAPDGIPAVRFELAAQALFIEWRQTLETRLRSPELAAMPALEAHLAKYRSLMPALALLFYVVDVADGGNAGTGVPLGAAKIAAAWCDDFLEPHARKVLAGAIRPGITAAHALAAKITAGAVQDRMTVRDIARREWAGLAREGAVHEAIDALTAAGWVRRERLHTGGRPSDVVHLHPDLLGAAR